MATTYKETLFTGRTVEFTTLTMKHFDLFLETLKEKKSLLTFYIELLIDNDLLVAVGSENEDGLILFPKDEKDKEKAKLSLLPCEVYEIMKLVRLKSIGEEVALTHEWEKGKPTTHRFSLLDAIVESKVPLRDEETLKPIETLDVELSKNRTITIQKGTIGQIRKHSHNIKKGNASEMIAMHNPREKRQGEDAEKPPISLSISELKKLNWSDSPKLMKACGEMNGSYSIHVEISNPTDKSETVKVDLLSYEGFAAFFALEDSPV